MEPSMHDQTTTEELLALVREAARLLRENDTEEERDAFYARKLALLARLDDEAIQWPTRRLTAPGPFTAVPLADDLSRCGRQMLSSGGRP
jgi:hypothetical protein